MERMNQVSVSEFFAKSKEELYDMAVEMVEKYNRLVDICNDSAERMAELKKESEKWKDLAKMNRDTICNLKKELDARGEEIKKLEEKVKHQRENLDGINKTLDIKIKENERLIAVKNNKDKEIEAHESENARLTEKIKELKKERDNQMARVNDLRMELDCVKASKEKHEEAAHDKVVADLRESFNYWRTQCLAAQEERDALQKELDHKNQKVNNLTKELEKTYKKKETDLKNHNKRDMTLVDELAKKNDEIKDLKGTIEYYKNQERIRTDQLRATERKVDALWKENERLKKDSKNKSEMIRKAYTRYVDEACKDREEIMNECYKNITKDNTGYLGFREYTLRALEKTKGDAKEAKEYICNAADVIIYDKKAKERRKEEEIEVKGVGRTNSGRYPWGAKVNDIPCGEDAIE